MKKALHRPVKDKLPPVNPQRIIGDVGNRKSGPVAIFFAGIHGNEPAGVIALEQLILDLSQRETEMLGRVIAVRGNIKALEKQCRYLDEDLNRLWTKQAVQRIRIKPVLLEEEREMLEILGFIEDMLDASVGPFYFFDLHTTSGKSTPFLTINDALANRKFAARFPVPIILGIEEYLTGPLLSYVNELGYVALGFEAGQHQDPKSIERCVAFSHLCLEFSGILPADSLPSKEKAYQALHHPSFTKNSFFEIIEVYKVAEFEVFRMLPGFESFQKLEKGIPVALHQGREVLFPYDAHIFMPLYQSQGKEGFFVIRNVPRFFLNLSALLRKFRFDNLLVWLPGVSWENRKKEILRVDRKVAKYLAKPLFHLLGYRLKVVDGRFIRLYNRERATKKQAYEEASWW